MLGPIFNTIIGAGVKLGANFINAWIEQKRQDQLMLAARDDKMFAALVHNQKSQASNPFTQITRRILFLSITFTLCVFTTNFLRITLFVCVTNFLDFTFLP